MLHQAVILAGGFGKRLGEITQKKQKVFLNFGDKPFLDYIVSKLILNGIKEVNLCLGYKAQEIIQYYSNNRKVKCHIEKYPLGTGGALNSIVEKLDRNFVVLNGDSFLNENLANVFKKNDLDKTLEFSHMLLTRNPNENEIRYGSVKMDKRKITSFSEKVDTSEYINAGIYFMNREHLSFCQSEKFSLENDLFPKLAKKSLLYGITSESYFIDIGTPESLEKAKNELGKYINND